MTEIPLSVMEGSGKFLHPHLWHYCAAGLNETILTQDLFTSIAEFVEFFIWCYEQYSNAIRWCLDK